MAEAALLSLGVAWAPLALSAEPPAAESESWKVKGSDPSEMITRLEIREEYLSLPDNGYLNQVYLRGDYAPNENLAFRLQLPLAAGRQEDLGNHFGLGNMTLGSAGKLILNEKLSWIMGIDFTLDTATQAALGSGWNQIMPSTALVFKPTPFWIFNATYQYIGSFGGDHNNTQPSIDESTIRLGALYNFPNGYWVYLDPRIYIDHTQKYAVSVFPEGEAGKVVAPDVEVWLRGGGRAAGNGRDERMGWVAETGIRYFFH